MKCVRIRSYSGLYFPAFRLNMERYSVSLRIQSKCGEIWTRITPNTDTFYTVNRFFLNKFFFLNKKLTLILMTFFLLMTFLENVIFYFHNGISLGIELKMYIYKTYLRSIYVLFRGGCEGTSKPMLWTNLVKQEHLQSQQ